LDTFDLATLERFVVRAKASTYVGDGTRLIPYRLGSHDLQYADGDWIYHDSYIGESDFAGQEVVYFRQKAIWVMNYYGRILRPDVITGAEAGRVIKASLSALYHEGRFLGGFHHVTDPYTYSDTNEGDVAWFQGREWITAGDDVAYELVYHGGLIR
jgi:Domain of unknown function (DUF5680)